MHISKRITRLLMVLFASIALVGCDSNEDDEAGDAERFLGDWVIVSAADQNGARDQSAVLATVGTLSVDLNDDGSYSLVVMSADPETDDVSLTGNYSVNESSGVLTLAVQVEGLPQVDLPLSYMFNSDTEVEFTADATTLALLLGIATLEGNVVLVAQKQ